MPYLDDLDMLAFQLKLIGKQSNKTVLISAGKLDDKKRMLPAIRKLAGLNISIFATPGTSRFLDSEGIANRQIYKIADGTEPNILSFLNEDRFDLIINVLTGDHDYDEASDSNLIRKQSIEKGIPLITDVDVAILTIDRLVDQDRAGTYRYKLADGSQPWNLRLDFMDMVAERGGFCNYHAHFDKAYLISGENLRLSMVDMQKKWSLYKHLKENYTREDLLERIGRGVEAMIAQGVTHCRSHIDADSTVGLLPIQAAIEVREKYRDRIHLEFAIQPLQGVVDPESRRQFAKACELADVVGGLPSKDRPTPEKHIDIIMSIAKDLGKPVDVHVDQENNPFEDETEMLAIKAMDHGLEGRVSAVHAISVAAKHPIEQDRIFARLKDAGVSVIVCPSAALSMKQLELAGPLHNSIAPVPRMLEAGVKVYLGVDNIADLFMPLVDGDMWFECRLLMEACRFYDLGKVADLACDRGGFSTVTRDEPVRRGSGGRVVQTSGA